MMRTLIPVTLVCLAALHSLFAMTAIAAGPKRAGARPELVEPTTADDAVRKALGYLETRGVAWMRERKCASCHHVPMMIWTMHEAQRRGFDEALLLNSQGLVAEGSGENLFVVKDGAIVTNDKDASILMGVTRASVLEIARDLGIAATVAPISVEDVLGADELFFTGTAVEVTAIREVDGRVISGGKPGPVTRRIQDTFNQAVRGELPQYRRWLSFVRQEVRA